MNTERSQECWTGDGFEAFRACASVRGKLELAPPAAYTATGVRALAARLGFGSNASAGTMDVFCEPALREGFCAYADCSVPVAAFTWVAPYARELTGLLILKEPDGGTRGYRAGSLQLYDPDTPCNCSAGSEFARVDQVGSHVIVVSYFAQNKMGRMCSEAYSKSTWLLDERMRPVVVVFAPGETGPALAEVVRNGDQVRVRAQGRCEATVTWLDLVRAANFKRLD